ncbi:MAG TPA: hypothetical protein VKK06_11595 [Terriglobia bacterium]|nr:hypothetical protein [Terriglobia bacterium]
MRCTTGFGISINDRVISIEQIVDADLQFDPTIKVRRSGNADRQMD